MREITQRQLRNESGEIMRELDRGESFVPLYTSNPDDFAGLENLLDIVAVPSPVSPDG